MQLGIEQASLARRAFRQLNLHMLNAGVAFIRARDAATDFAALVESYQSQISRASVYRYMAYAEAIIAQAAASKPELKDTDQLLEYARDMVIQSPRPLVAVLRADGALRKFGEYDSVRYQRKKLGIPKPIVLRWATVMDHLDALARIGEDHSVRVAVPDGTDERESLRVLRDRLQAALAALDQHLSTIL
jgi:hypothetical protein